MYATQFPNDFPPMPDGFMEAVSADPGAFAGAMGGGMEAMEAHMEANPGDMEGGFEAMGAAMEGPMADMGISPEMFEAAGDTFGAIAGPAMEGMPADAGPADMGQCMNDCMNTLCQKVWICLLKWVQCLTIWLKLLMQLIWDHMTSFQQWVQICLLNLHQVIQHPSLKVIMVQLTWVLQRATWVVAQVT